MARTKERHVGHCGLSISRRKDRLYLSVTGISRSVFGVIDGVGGRLAATPPKKGELARLLAGDGVGDGWYKLQAKRHAEVALPEKGPWVERLARELDEHRARHGGPMPALIEVFLTDDGAARVAMVKAPTSP